MHNEIQTDIREYGEHLDFWNARKSLASKGVSYK